jgi:hypothetical protein
VPDPTDGTRYKIVDNSGNALDPAADFTKRFKPV